MAEQAARTVTARDLLHGFLELRRLTPDMGEWSEERLAGNPPRLFRFRRLVGLFRAFGLDWDPASFTEGKFIHPESPQHESVLERVAAEMPAAVKLGLGPKSHQLPRLFAILLRYRETVEAALSFSSGVLEASGLYAYAYRKTEKLNRVIQDNVAIIEDVLVALISPEGKTYAVDQLTRDHGYPDVDLFEIDADWW